MLDFDGYGDGDGCGLILDLDMDLYMDVPQHLQVSPKPKQRSPKKHKIVEPPTPSNAKEHLYACQSEFDPNKSKQEIVYLKKKVSALRAKIQRRNLSKIWVIY